MSVFHSINRVVNRAGDDLQTLSWAVMRVLSSTMFMTHGWAKLFGENAQPMFGGMDFFGINLGINMLWIAGVIEVFAAGFVAIGLFTRYAALLCAILMVMAYASAHLAWFPTLNNGELAAMYFVVYLVLFCFGAGKFSLDAMMKRR